MSIVDLSYLQQTLQGDAELRDHIRDAARQLERDVRACQLVLNRVHSLTAAQTPALLAQLEPLLAPVRSSIKTVADLVPGMQYWRYNDTFARTVQAAAFVVVFRAYLDRAELASKDSVAAALGIDEAWRDHFFLSTEDYLHALISLINELSRLAVNRVTLADYDSPVRFASFAKELSGGFGMLNLKNDSLRKRYDSIKYDVKKLEEVVYDLSLRGLLKPSTDQPDVPMKSA